MNSIETCRNNHQQLARPGVPDQASCRSSRARSPYPQKRHQPGDDDDDDDAGDDEDDDDDDENDNDDDKDDDDGIHRWTTGT